MQSSLQNRNSDMRHLQHTEQNPASDDLATFMIFIVTIQTAHLEWPNYDPYIKSSQTRATCRSKCVRNLQMLLQIRSLLASNPVRTAPQLDLQDTTLSLITYMISIKALNEPENRQLSEQ